MTWLVALFTEESVARTLLLLCLAIFPGLLIGNLGFKGAKVGIAGVLFSGLLIGAVSRKADPHVTHFVREFGLVLFVFAVGLQVGPGFFANFKQNGFKLNALAAAIVALGVATAAGLKVTLNLPLDAAIGILSGAVTNTPGLGAAQQALRDHPSFGDAGAATAGGGYAVAYPFGIIGIILAMLLIRAVFRIHVSDEKAAFDAARSHGADDVQTYTVQVNNPLLDQKSVAHLRDLVGRPIVISRISRDGNVAVPCDTHTLLTGDQLQVVCNRSDLERVTSIIGVVTDRDLRQATTSISARQIMVSKSSACRQTLQQSRYQERLGVRVTRVLRSAVEFVPDEDTHLHVGDQIVAVGSSEGIDALSNELGNSRVALEHPNFLPIFLGIFLGVVIGTWPLPIPGIPSPVKLGLAGGPLLVALGMGMVGRIGPMHFYLPSGAGQFMRELGILLFLGAVGVGSGSAFVSALHAGEGWKWMFAGAVITIVPLVIVGMIARRSGLNYLTISGLLAGSMTDPPALGFANAQSPSVAPAVAYAAVYPFTMFLRIMTAQLFVIFLSH